MNETSEPPAESNTPAPSEAERWKLAFETLGRLLGTSHGVVSSTALRRELERRGMDDARAMVLDLRFLDLNTLEDRGLPAPGFRYHHHGRSFYAEDKYKETLEEAEAATEEEADAASSAFAGTEDEEEPTAPTRTNRQEEARLVAYVKSALEELYASDHAKEGEAYVFDVHSTRQGASFENVDVIAVHWRSAGVVDLVTVEVKLEFSAEVVQQALNYRRFSQRAWIAVPVETDAASAAFELRERNVALFEYAIESGLGILACHRRQGRKYNVFPVHWPRRSNVDPLEHDGFLLRYHSCLEEAGAVEPASRKAFPKIR